MYCTRTELLLVSNFNVENYISHLEIWDTRSIAKQFDVKNYAGVFSVLWNY
jgi:hypothetical protein